MIIPQNATVGVVASYSLEGNTWAQDKTSHDFVKVTAQPVKDGKPDGAQKESVMTATPIGDEIRLTGYTGGAQSDQNVSATAINLP